MVSVSIHRLYEIETPSSGIPGVPRESQGDTRPVPDDGRQTADSSVVTLTLTPKQIAALIADAVRASLAVALERGCTSADADDVARAAGANAATALMAYDADPDA